ncbi:unnamed protein product [Miscanthus lutarioriparius]|uniref:phosphoribosylformylglycinamidine cyclo-ligase n=1 Tax=Miscanthus lutarioriparius TaxID=422564 RepID=A0A811S058_9POAL|nr:unnamed protein product [Miscanthus lutarioriparius]
MAAADRVLHFLRGPTGSPAAAAPARAARRGLPQTHRLHFRQAPAGTRRASVSCRSSSTSSSSGGEGRPMYKDAGVNVDASNEFVRRIARMTPGIGGFSGLFALGDDYLAASADGVGTKLKLAFETGIHDTVGIDLVAMCVNDIITSGARPLFFLDYYATSKLDVDVAEKVIKGIKVGCQQSGFALLGGETAEMPGFYAEGEYDLCGFALGIVEKDKVIDGNNIVKGDVLIGLPSSGSIEEKWTFLE